MHSTNSIERLIGAIKRPIEVVGISLNEAAIMRLIGTISMEQSDEWAVQRARYMTNRASASRVLPIPDRPTSHTARLARGGADARNRRVHIDQFIAERRGLSRVRRSDWLSPLQSSELVRRNALSARYISFEYRHRLGLGRPGNLTARGY